jgi:catechol-2,3-dioxygenase
MQRSAGLDHLAFTVADREELDAWAARLADAAVVDSPVTAANLCRSNTRLRA